MIRYASGSTGLQAWLTQAQAHWLESSGPHQTACQGSPANEVELPVILTQLKLSWVPITHRLDAQRTCQDDADWLR